MSIATERRHQMVFGLATCRRKGLVHAFRQGRAKESVVLDVDPQHRHARCAAELTGRFHQFVWRAIVVRLAIDAAAAAGGKDDDGLDLRRVQA